jgi:hypothetical protein
VSKVKLTTNNKPPLNSSSNTTQQGCNTKTAKFDKLYFIVIKRGIKKQ